MHEKGWNVIVLGAGASKSEAPNKGVLQGELLSTYFAIKKQEFVDPICRYEKKDMSPHELTRRLYDLAMSSTSPAESSEILRYLRLRVFMDRFFGVNVFEDPGECLFPTFEELLGTIELALARQECFRGYGSPYGLATFDLSDGERVTLSLSRSTKPTIDDPRFFTKLINMEESLAQIREDLLHAIAVTLALSLSNPVGHHLNLIKALLDWGQIENTIFLSLNYDILIDNAINRNTLVPDYGIDFRMKPEERERSVSLLKLHGSLNWLYCPRCVQIDHTGTHKTAVETARRVVPCLECHQSMTPVLIPPTFLKDISNPYIQTVWLSAINKLRNVSRVFFCGYSLPEADIQVKYLLKRAQVNKHVGDSFGVYIANGKPKNDPEDELRKRWEQGRFERFFGEETVHNTEMDFQTFVNNGFDFEGHR